jgi:glycosyltransferase involved in cell wall biosynthesis
MPPTVSVLMNCYNSDRFLEEAICSVFAQTFDDWEIVFWDNQSTDRSPEIAQRYAGKLKYFRGEEFLPLGAARNEALKKAQGRYVALLDCDDIWLPEKLAKQVPLLEKDSSVGLIFSNAAFIDASGNISGTFFDRIPLPRGNLFLGLLTGRNYIPCPTAVFRRDAAERAGGFNTALKYTEELELFLKIGLESHFNFVPDVLAKYRLHGNNATGTGNAATTREAVTVLRAMSRRLGSPTWKDRWAIFKRYGALNAKLAWQTVKHPLS